MESVRIRQTARKAFDLTQLGSGSAERLCSALILGAAFFFIVGMLAHMAKLETTYVVVSAGVALLSVMATSSVLVLWGSDAELAEQLPRLKTELAELRKTAAEDRAARKTEKALRAAHEAARPKPTTKHCPYCREEILIYAVKCKHCGEILDEELRTEQRLRPQQHWNPGVAAVLSFFWPGLGQIYKGQVLNGIAWLLAVALGYACCLVPGFILHVLCIFGAASGSEY
jgi:hypothetical protein